MTSSGDITTYNKDEVDVVAENIPTDGKKTGGNKLFATRQYQNGSRGRRFSFLEPIVYILIAAACPVRATSSSVRSI